MDLPKKKSGDFIYLVSRQVASKAQSYTLCHLFSHLPSFSLLQQPEASWETMSTLKCESSQQRVNLNRKAWTNSGLNVSLTVCRSIWLKLRYRLSCSHHSDHHLHAGHPSPWHPSVKSQSGDRDLRNFCSKRVAISFHIHCEFNAWTDCLSPTIYIANSWLWLFYLNYFPLLCLLPPFIFLLFLHACRFHAVAHFWLG